MQNILQGTLNQLNPRQLLSLSFMKTQLQIENKCLSPFWHLEHFRRHTLKCLGNCISMKINQCCHNPPRIQRFHGCANLSQ